LRIALLSESREFGGAEQYLLSLAGGVTRLGHEVHMLSPSGARWPLRGRGIWEIHAPSRFVGASWPSWALWLFGTLRRLKPDVLHINLPSTYSASFSASALMGKALGCAVVTTEHLSMIGRSRRRALLKDMFAPHVQKVIAVSEATAVALKEEHRVPADKVVIIYNGVDADGLSFLQRPKAREKLGIADNAIAIGCVGELIPRKGQSCLIEAFAGLAEHLRNGVELVIIGEGRDRGRLQEKIERCGLRGVARLVGAVEKASSLFKAFDLFAMPSLMEAMPFALLEAMAAGLPAVGSSAWGIPEVIVHGETGLLFPPGDVEALRRSLEALLVDPALRAGMGRRAENIAAEKFSLDTMVRKTVDVYLTAAGGR
jgi:glycosyltransferase involved in cell wall biosynthesis